MVALFSLPAQGQESELKDRLDGTWEVDVQASKELGPQAAEAVNQMEILKARFTIEFTKDEKFIVTHFAAGKQRSKKSGTWKVLKAIEDRLILDITNDGESSPSKMIVEFLLDNDGMKLSPEKKPKNKDPTLIFRRAAS